MHHSVLANKNAGAGGSRRFRRQSLTVYPKNMGIFVAFCSFLALALGPGLMNAYGVYEEEYNRLYDNKDGGHYSSALGAPVIFVGVIQIFITSTLRPMGYSAMHRLGPGPCVFVGGIVMSVGLLSASYSHHVWEIFLTQGVVFGIGVCLVWVSAASAPLSWFGKKRSTATGITHMGMGIGGFVYSQLSRYFLEKSGTGGSLRWLSLTTLVGATVVSLGIHKRHHEQPSQDSKEEQDSIATPNVHWSRYLEDEIDKIPTSFDRDSDIEYDGIPCTPSAIYSKADAAEDDCGQSHTAIDNLHVHNMKSTRMILCSEPGTEIRELDANFKAGGAKKPSRLSPNKPKTVRTSKHVHFAPDVYRKAALDRLESIVRNDSFTNKRRRASQYSQGQHRRTAQMRPPQTDTIVSTNAMFGPTALPGHLDPKTETSDDSGYTNIVRSWKMWLFFLGAGMGQVGWYLLLLFSTSVSVSVGLDVRNAAMILGTVNAASAVGRFAAGYVANMIGPTNSLLISAVLATASSAILFIPGLGFRLLVTYACLCGVSIGAADLLTSMAATTQFGMPRAFTAVSIVYGSIGVFVAILAPNAQIAIEQIGHGGTTFTPLYIFIVVVFSTSALLLLAFKLCTSSKFLNRV